MIYIVVGIIVVLMFLLIMALESIARTRKEWDEESSQNLRGLVEEQEWFGEEEEGDES